MARSILDMTDDEIMGLDDEQLAAMEASESSNEAESEDEESEDDAGTASEDSESDDEDEVDDSADDSDDADDDDDSKETEEDSDNEDETAESNDSAEGATESDLPEGKEGKAADVKPEDKTKVETPATVAVDYKAAYEKLLAPFKANGKEIKVDSVDEALTLMQMGANYSKKMSGLKPSLKLLKMLENNDLLDEDKLSHLIDISRKNPAAIAKAMKDAGIDPLDLDGAEDYTPQTYTVSDQSLELDEVLADLRGTPGYATTLNIVTSKWDAASRNLVLQQPTIIRDIAQHVESGVYDKVMAEVDRQRMLGRLAQVSDIEAYKLTGDAMYNNPANVAPKQEPVVISKGTTTNLAKPADKQNVQRMKAVAPLKTKVKATEPEFNPLALSDAEFEAYAAKNKFF